MIVSRLCVGLSKLPAMLLPAACCAIYGHCKFLFISLLLGRSAKRCHPDSDLPVPDICESLLSTHGKAETTLITFAVLCYISMDVRCNCCFLFMLPASNELLSPSELLIQHTFRPLFGHLASELTVEFICQAFLVSLFEQST